MAPLTYLGLAPYNPKLITHFSPCALTLVLESGEGEIRGGANTSGGVSARASGAPETSTIDAPLVAPLIEAAAEDDDDDEDDEKPPLKLRNAHAATLLLLLKSVLLLLLL
jgi:hypothetical protein